MEKIKILYIVRAMNMGGIENYIMNIMRHIDRTVYEIDFLYTRTVKTCYFDQEIINYGSQIYKLKNNSHHVKAYLAEVREFFYTHPEYQIIHIHNDASFCFLEAKQAKKAGVRKVIVHSHNSSAHHKIIHYICRPLVRKYADKYYACSKLAGEWMFSKKVSKQGFVTVMNNAINVTKFAFEADVRSQVRAELNLGDVPVLGIIGRLSEQKNHAFLIEVMDELVKKAPNVILLIIGEGSLESVLRERVKEKGLTKHVRFLGVRSDVDRILSALDYFILPSLYEGLPVVLVEAQASGVQCIVSDTITREVEVTDRITYVPLEIGSSKWADLIFELQCNTLERVSYSQYVRAAGYDMNDAAEKLADEYRQMNEVNTYART